MVVWHYRLNGQEFEQALGDGEGQGSLESRLSAVHEVAKGLTQLSKWTTDIMILAICRFKTVAKLKRFKDSDWHNCWCCERNWPCINYWLLTWINPWTARRSNQLILKEIVLNIRWKDWCWSWNSITLATWCDELTLWKRLWCWERLKAGGEGDNWGWTTEVGWHHWLYGHEFEQALGAADGQGSLACCRSWGRKESDMTDWTKLN